MYKNMNAAAELITQSRKLPVLKNTELWRGKVTLIKDVNGGVCVESTTLSVGMKAPSGRRRKPGLFGSQDPESVWTWA